MNETSTALAVININALEDIKIDENRRLNMDEKKRLFEIVRRAFSNKRDILKARAQEVREAIIKSERSKSDWKLRVSKIKKLEDQITALKSRVDKEIESMEQTTGFDKEGVMCQPRKCETIYVQGGCNRYVTVINKEAERIDAKANLAAAEFERFDTKFDKIEAKLLLCSTYGDARQVVAAVLGNGDNILG